jgi:hypothetical protein
MTPQIGQWARRLTPRADGSSVAGKWHLVDSVVAGDVVTRCGRRLRDDKPLEISLVEPLTRMIGQPQNCKVCG